MRVIGSLHWPGSIMAGMTDDAGHEAASRTDRIIGAPPITQNLMTSALTKAKEPRVI